MTLAEFIQSEKELFTSGIERKVTRLLEEPFSTTPYYTETLTKLAAFAVRGKMIRGLLIPYTYQKITGSDSVPDTVWNAAVVLELMHAALLIHDDVIDNDPERRGEKSVYADYASGKTQEYGKNMAICAGDCAFFIGFALLSEDPDANTVRIINLLSRELLLVGIGEMQDIAMADASDSPSPEAIETMYLLKTARYTFSLPFMAGALYANAPQPVVDLLEKAGEHIGVLFQIQDDELGITGTTEATGKPVGSDIREGKKTVSRHLLFHEATEAERTLLEAVFGNKNATKQDIQQVIQLYSAKGIPARIWERLKIRKEQIRMIESELVKAYPEMSICSEVMTILENRTT